MDRQQQQNVDQDTKMLLLEQRMNSILDQLKNKAESPECPMFSNTHELKVFQFWNKFNRAKNSHDKENPDLIRRFYTEKGHKLLADLYLNGYGKDLGKYVCIFFKTEQGNFDDAIKWPIRANISFSIDNAFDKIIDEIDTKDNKLSFKKSNTDGNTAYGSTLVDLQQLQYYVVDNILTITIKVNYY